jgi:hypothetical protein
MFTYSFSTSILNLLNIYSFPGTIPCGQCGSYGAERVSAKEGTGLHISDPLPNPSSGDFSITYNLTAEYNKGAISFYDMSGKLVKTVNVNSKNNTVLVHKGDL